MRHLLALAAVHLLIVALPAEAQETEVLLSVDAALADYGIEGVDDVRHGRVALVHDPAGPRIALHFLRPEPPSGQPAPDPATAVELSGGSDRTPEVRALWVWNTAEILADEDERASFLDFVSEQSIERVFLYVPPAEGRSATAGFVPFDGAALGPLLAQMRARGALAYALDGDPEYVRPENHAGVLRTVRRVVEHNRTRPSEEHFYGVRYDVEPYILAGFQGPRRREILNDYVTLLASIADVARRGGLHVGADIPFWLDAGDEVTGEAFEAEFEGERAPVLDLVMSLVDDVGIMAYRTAAEGPNGVLHHATREVDLGNRGSAKVYVGVETTRIYDEDLYTLRGSGRSGLPPLPDARWVVFEELEGSNVRVSLVEGADMLAQLASRTPDPERLTYWFAGQSVPLPGALISFESLGAQAMRSVTAQIERRFQSQPAYLGLAFHDYRGLRALLER